MQIYYCEDCGQRISTEELESGAARSVAENQYVCGECLKKRAPAAPAQPQAQVQAPARATPKGTVTGPVRVGTGVVGAREPASASGRRAGSAEASASARAARPAQQTGLPLVPMLAGGGVVLVILLAIVFSRGEKPAPPNTAQTDRPVEPAPTNAASTQTQTPAPVEKTTANTTAPATAPAAKNTPVTPPAPATTTIEDYREGYAQRKWAELKREAESATPGGDLGERLRNFASTYSSTAAGREAKAFFDTSPQFKAPDESSIFAQFLRDWRPEKPGPGWSYLINSRGPIGQAANYTPLLWNAKHKQYCGDAETFPHNSPLNWSFIESKRIHPGSGAQDRKVNKSAFDRFTIVAYTLQPDQGCKAKLWIKLNRVKGDNLSLELRVYVNDKQVAGSVSKNTEYNLMLGELKPGDTVYVALGPNQADGEDSSTMDFKLYKIE